MQAQLEEARLNVRKVEVAAVEARDPRPLRCQPRSPRTCLTGPRSKPRSRRVRACHLLVYRTVLERGFERALVLEDDVLLPAGFAELTGAIAEEMSGAEVVLLNFHVEERVQLMRSGSRSVPFSRVLADPVGLRGWTSAGAYLDHAARHALASSRSLCQSEHTPTTGSFSCANGCTRPGALRRPDACHQQPEQVSDDNRLSRTREL